MQSLPLVEQVWDVIRDWKNLHGFDLWPADEAETKRKFIEFCFAHDFVTLLVDSSSRLEGFLFFYRSWQFEGCDIKRPEPNGDYVVCDVFWIRPDLSHAETAKKLIKKAVREHRDKLLGAGKIVFFRQWNNFDPVIYDFPKFFRKFS